LAASACAGSRTAAANSDPKVRLLILVLLGILLSMGVLDKKTARVTEACTPPSTRAAGLAYSVN
jgi:hypothetical protein